MKFVEVVVSQINSLRLQAHFCVQWSVADSVHNRQSFVSPEPFGLFVMGPYLEGQIFVRGWDVDLPHPNQRRHLPCHVHTCIGRICTTGPFSH